MQTAEPIPTDALTCTRRLLDLDPRSERRRMGLSAAQLAELMGCSESAVTRWETGTRAPRPQQMLRLYALLLRLRARQPSRKVAL
ncbi:MAG: helix-turn-helix transcriptional regulator [Actinobacteria bacterium]|nr:helix-turn-helix transcriptional regulator [Actinomycetota bacterium]